VASAPAKINLSLGVGAVREDGYHPLATVYQAIGLFDEVAVSRDAGDDWTVRVEGDERLSVADVPTDESNLAMRAARLLAEHHGIKDGLRINVLKGIPVAGGMAGGSADAAAALVACDALWGTATPREELLEIAAELGSDVPFALVGGTAIGSGRGEIVTPVMTRGSYWWVVLESSEGLSTPAVYREFDRMHAGSVVGEPEIPDTLLQALGTGDVEKLAASLSNDLQPAALRLRPELRDAMECGLENSAHAAILSGSGPSCLFLTEGQAHAWQVAGALRSTGYGPVSYARGPVPGARVIR
jgi:4-diphosphocytidyl-2-C-methyl-D-erythritol kinase